MVAVQNCDLLLKCVWHNKKFLKNRKKISLLTVVFIIYNFSDLRVKFEDMSVKFILFYYFIYWQILTSLWNFARKQILNSLYCFNSKQAYLFVIRVHAIKMDSFFFIFFRKYFEPVKKKKSENCIWKNFFFIFDSVKIEIVWCLEFLKHFSNNEIYWSDVASVNINITVSHVYIFAL